MKTSTPTGSPLRKKHSIYKNFVGIEDNLIDLEVEKENRRLETINKSAEVRRKSTAAPLLSGLTANQLAQHLKDCIKLSTENKINTKNAFSFMLIDVMAAMAKKHDSEINQNFQVASCTLDASVKIYGYRVDAVHTDAVKMAGGVLGKEVVSGDEGEGNENEEEKKNEPKKTKKKRKKLTIVQPESINAKSESEVLLDVIPRQNLLTMKADGNDLLIKIPKYNDGGLLYLDSEEPCWPYDENASLVQPFANIEIFNTEGLFSLFKEIRLEPDDKLCADYSNIEFGKDSDDVDSGDELEISQNSDRFEFDINASIQDEPMSCEADDTQPNLQKNRIEVPIGGYESGDEIVLPPMPLQKNQKITISDMKKRISINPLEYSRFDEQVFKSWAGPTYWKVKPTSRKIVEEENKENEDVSKQVGSKRQRKGKVKEPVGLFELTEETLKKYLSCASKTKLCSSTMLKWSAGNTTIPKDCKYKSKNLFSLYNIPAILIQPKQEIEDGTELDDTDDKNDNDRAEEPEEELEYCSSMIMNDDYNSQAEDEPKEVKFGEEVEAWDEGNMVEMPNKVEKIAVSSFKRKKHVDIKHLKKCIWSMIKDSDDHVKTPIKFSDIIKFYPTKMPNNLVSCLSAPMIFNALLHLTNEKCLILKSEKSDFVISQ